MTTIPFWRCHQCYICPIHFHPLNNIPFPPDKHTHPFLMSDGLEFLGSIQTGRVKKQLDPRQNPVRNPSKRTFVTHSISVLTSVLRSPSSFTTLLNKSQKNNNILLTRLITISTSPHRNMYSEINL